MGELSKRFNKGHVAEAMSSLLEKLLDNKKAEIRDIAGIALKTVAEEMPNHPALTGKNVDVTLVYDFRMYMCICLNRNEIAELSSSRGKKKTYRCCR